MKKSKGVTLVELIIVLAIIGVLTTVIVGSTAKYHEEARDGRRKADIKEIQIDLAQYYNFYQRYPATLNDLGGFILGGVGNIPTDPQSHQSYYYAPVTANNLNYSYCIGANLESTLPSDNQSSCNPGVNGNPNYMQKPLQ